jgi:hypothetical protein
MTFPRVLAQCLLLMQSFAQQTVYAREQTLPGLPDNILPMPFQEGSVLALQSLLTHNAQLLPQVNGINKFKPMDSHSTSVLSHRWKTFLNALESAHSLGSMYSLTSLKESLKVLALTKQFKW